MSSRPTFFQHWLKLSWLAVLGVVLGAWGKVAWIQKQPPLYVSFAKLTPRDAERPDWDRMRTESLALLTSTTLQEKAWRRYERLDRAQGRPPEELLRSVRIAASPVATGRVIRLDASGPHPKTIRMYLDTLLDEFMAGPHPDGIRISDRASAGVLDEPQFLTPATTWGILGGVVGLAVSCALAGICSSMRGASSPADHGNAAEDDNREPESFSRASSRYSFLVWIGLGVGASVQWAMTDEVDTRPHWRVVLRTQVTSEAGRHALSQAGTILTGEAMFLRASRLLGMTASRSDLGTVDVSTNLRQTAAMELRVRGEDPTVAQMFIEALLLEFEKDEESKGISHDAPVWTQNQPPSPPGIFLTGGLKGGAAGFVLALLITAILRVLRDQPPHRINLPA